MKPRIESLLNLIYLTNYSIASIQRLILNSNSEEQLIDRVQLKYTEEEIRIAKKKTADSIISMDKYGVYAIPYYSREYPDSLLAIKDHPPLLFVKGTLRVQKLIAIVGSRDTSKFANKITINIVDWCNELKLGVISGLAVGIDTMAHRQCLNSNNYTVAVLPCSLDKIYPISNSQLAIDIIAQGGALITEFAYGLKMNKRSFVKRNRIQAALAKIVLPVEMRTGSGTSHTIQYAIQYDKPVFVLRPTPLLMIEDSYQGIVSLISKPFDGLHVFIDKADFMQQAQNIIQ